MLDALQHAESVMQVLASRGGAALALQGPQRVRGRPLAPFPDHEQQLFGRPLQHQLNLVSAAADLPKQGAEVKGRRVPLGAAPGAPPLPVPPERRKGRWETESPLAWVSVIDPLLGTHRVGRAEFDVQKRKLRFG